VSAHELRLILTVDDLDGALELYRDALGLEQLEEWTTETSRGVLLAAGRATLELADEGHAAEVDRLEVGRRVAGPVRIAFAVDDSAAAAERLVDAGAGPVAGPVETPWGDVNVRLETADGLQLTLFSARAG
jgi:catechol 2,3-dioxygenase-like lactoylglutathione lyase family enzyme